MSKTWLNELELSANCLRYCIYIEDKLELTKFITTSIDSLIYCENIKDKPEIRKNIIYPQHIRAYYYSTVEKRIYNIFIYYKLISEYIKRSKKYAEYRLEWNIDWSINDICNNN